MNPLGPRQPILIVEDSPEDYEATLRALRRSGVEEPIVRCENGDDLLEYLRRCGNAVGPGAAPRPRIILLDLNLPGTDGREVLREIKSDESLRSIPVVVLTTSTDERDIERCYQAGANSYMKKPVHFKAFMRSIQRFADFWFQVAILPVPGGNP